MKKLLSILLAFSMVVGLLTGITLTASAEEVERIDITGIPAPVFGESIAAENIQVSGDREYYVQVEWLLWNGEYGYMPVETDTFGYGEYLLNLYIVPAENAVYDFPYQITVDGTPIEELQFNWWHEDESTLRVETSMYIEPENGYIHFVATSGAPFEIEAGQDIVVPELVVEDGMVTITDVQWLDSQKAPVSGKFEDGEAYYLAVTVEPAEAGYGFEPWVDADIGGRPTSSVKQQDGSAIIYARYSLRPTVDTFAVTVDMPEIGAAPAQPKMDNDKAAISSYVWRDYNTGEEVVKFEDGKKYMLEIEIRCAEGYDVGGDVKVTLNGDKNIEYGQNEDALFIWQPYTFQNVIDRIDVTMPEPALGQTPDYTKIQVSGENYVIERAYWSGVFTGEEVTGAFEKDKYMLELEFLADEGSEFSRDCAIYLNGELMNIGHADDRYAYASAEFSLRDTISKVELPAFPDVKAGDEVEIIEFNAPEGAHYQIAGMWFDYNGGNMDAAEDVFEEGKIYYLMLEAIPERGYEFAEDAVVTVGGKEYTGLLTNVSEDYMSVFKMYALGVKTIDKIELNVPALEDGKPHGNITVPEDAGYTLEVQEWAVSDTDDVNAAEILEADEAAAYDKYYWFAAVVVAKEGYVFADDAQVFINGKPVELDPESSIVIGDMGQVIHGLGQLTKPADPSNPNTNDRMPVAPMMLLVALSVAGVAVTFVAKKRYF